MNVFLIKTCVLVCAFLISCDYIKPTSATTYQLNYEAIVSPDHVLKHAENPRNHNMLDKHARNIPPTIAEESIIAVGTNLFQQWLDKNYSKGKKLFAGESLPLDFNCFPVGSQTCHPPSTTCVMSHTSNEFSFRIYLETYEAEGTWQDYFDDEYESSEHSFSEDGQNNQNDDAACSEEKVPVALRVDCSITTPGTEARTFLIETIPVINSSIESLMSPIPVWSINERPSPLQMMKYLQNDHNRAPVTKENKSPTSMIQQDSLNIKNAQSIDNVILSNQALAGRFPIYSTTSYINYNKKRAATSSTAVQLPKQISVNTDIWQFQESGTEHATRAVFLNSTLRAITSTAGFSHAEAFIHPAMITHYDPIRVAVISDFPLQYIKELMKYENLKHIDIIGADWDAIEVSRKYVPQMDDCSKLQGLPSSCIDSPSLGVNTSQSLDDWVNFKMSERQQRRNGKENNDDGDFNYYDIIYLDVAASNAEDWLSPKLHQKLKKILSSESIMVINVGSTPSMDRNYDSYVSDYKERDDFFSRVTKRLNYEDGIGYEAAFVYDEETSYPLDSSFLIAFTSFGESYDRFTRDSSVAIDLDISLRFRKQSGNLAPLVLYDGVTHRKYTRPTRQWEEWFCHINLWKDTNVCDFVKSKLFDKSLHESATVVIRNEKGRSLIAGNDIKKGSFINSDDTYNSIHLDSIQWDNLNKFIENFPDATMYRELRNFFNAYGFESESLGKSGWSVSIANNNTFTNHACTEQEINAIFSNAYLGLENEELLFSPTLSRRPEMFSQITIARRDIKEGEEILMDYNQLMELDSDDAVEQTSLLEKICSNGEGLVSKGD